MTIGSLLLEAASKYTPHKVACRACATSHVAALAGELIVNAVQLEEDDRVLLTAQTDGKQNGPWVVKTDAWVRPVDFEDARGAAIGSTMLVVRGTNAGLWRMTSPTTGDVVPDQTETSWTKVGEFATSGTPPAVSPAEVLGRAAGASGSAPAEPLPAADVRDIVDEGRIERGTVDVFRYGATASYVSSGSPGTDDAPAIQAAIRALDPLRGGVVEIPFGRYRIAQPIYVDRRVIIRGRGGSTNYGSTQLIADAGVTPFVFMANSQYAPGQTVGVNYAGAQHSVIEHLRITARAKNTTTHAGAYDQPTHRITGLPSGHSFSVGQLVRIPGGGKATLLARGRVTATTVSGSANVTVNGIDGGNHNGIHTDAYLRIGDAYPTKTRVASVPESVVGTSYVLTMASAAAASGTWPVEYITDAFGRVLELSGANIAILDYGEGESTGTVDIGHGDSGMYIQTKVTVSHCAIGESGEPFQGAAIVVNASTGMYPSPPGYNANNFRLLDVKAQYNQHGGLVIQGQDANNGLIDGFDDLGPLVEPRWNIIDNSGLGCTFIGCHALGGYGFLSIGARGVKRDRWLGNYSEIGTFCSFSDGATLIGNDFGVRDYGGYGFIDGTWNRLQIGQAQEGGLFSSLQMSFDADYGFRYRAAAAASGDGDLFFRPKKAGDDGLPAGVYGYAFENSLQQGSVGLFITDTNNTALTNAADAAWNPGHVVAWRGLFLGSDFRGGLLSDWTLHPRYLGFAKDYPGSGTIQAPAAGWRTWTEGDLLINDRGHAANDGYFGWRCTAGGDPGTWQAIEVNPAGGGGGDRTSAGTLTDTAATAVNFATPEIRWNGVAMTSLAVGDSPVSRDASGASRFVNVYVSGIIDDATSGQLQIGNTYASGVEIGAAAGAVGFFGSGGTTKQTVTGNVTTGTLADLQGVVDLLLQRLAAYGLITDSTT